MLKQIICCLILLTSSSLTHCDEIKAEEITYDWLISCAEATSYTDHIPHFRRLFNTVKVRGFLECGCGFSTKYFMDHAERVVSVEFLHPGTSDTWFQKCLEIFQKCRNWVPLTYNHDYSDLPFYKACAYSNATQRDYSLIDSRYLDTLDTFFKGLLKSSKDHGYEIDVAFVDPGVMIRGDMVKLLLKNKVPIVMAHDTACDTGPDATSGYYSWFVVKPDPDYEKIHIPYGQGTTFWINKQLPHVIESIKNYRDMVINRASSYESLAKIADTF